MTNLILNLNRFVKWLAGVWIQKLCTNYHENSALRDKAWSDEAAKKKKALAEYKAAKAALAKQHQVTAKKCSQVRRKAEASIGKKQQKLLVSINELDNI